MRLAAAHCNLAKKGVEGEEAAVLRGAAQYLSASHPHLLLSIHTEALETECRKLLDELGYTSIVPLNESSQRPASEFWVSM